MRVRLPVAFVVFAALLSGAAAPARVQTPARDAAAQGAAAPAGTGLIAGKVVASDSGRPVRFARIVLVSAGGDTDATTVTDDTGSFAFAKLGPGRYTVSVFKDGYLDVTYGQTRPGTDAPGIQLQLGADQHLDSLTIRLPRGSAVAGTVVDDRR
jgi:uncharacterized protein (DUF2141 family)